MDQKVNAQTLDPRENVSCLDRDFARFHIEACALINQTSSETLYTAPTAENAGAAGQSQLFSVGESVLRGAAAIEQTFGGITANLWDDPFEWTLPEYLSTPEKVIDHLNEVEATRLRAFSSFTDDECLEKHIAVPAGGTLPLGQVLLETLQKTLEWQDKARLAVNLLSKNGTPWFII
jgi:hypothetical protein